MYNSCIRLYFSYVIFFSRGYMRTMSPRVWFSGALLWYLWSWTILFKDPCGGFGCLRWDVLGVGVVWRLWLGLGPPGALTWIVLARRRLPTAASGLLLFVQAPWNPGCTGVWPAPKWWKSYSWRICTSMSRVAATFLQGDWLSSSG